MILFPDEEYARMEAYRRGLNDHQIAQERCVSPLTIYGWRKRRGLPANHRKGPITHEENERRLRIFDENRGLGTRKMAKMMGISRSAYIAWAKKYGEVRVDENALAVQRDRRN